MDSEENDLSYPFCPVIDLATVRDAHKIAPSVSRLIFQIRIRMANIYLDEAKAYRLAGLPVPTQVLEDAERWEREHNVKRTS